MGLIIQKLTKDAFSPYGTFFDLRQGYGDGAISFLPDRMLHYIGSSSLDSLCSIQLRYRPLELIATEYHNDCEEVFGGFSCDIAFHVALLTTDGAIDESTIAVFRLPAGCFARVKRRVLHHAGFVLQEGDAAHGLVLLSPAAYTVDCHMLQFAKPIAFQQK